MEKYPVYTILPEYEPEEELPSERDGYLTKFWLNHPHLGLSLVKIDEDGAQAWAEKAAYEIAQLMNVPAARYEFGVLEGFEEFQNGSIAVISSSFRPSNLDYLPGINLLLQYSPYRNYPACGNSERFRARKDWFA